MLALRPGPMQVVVVVREAGELEAVLLERATHSVGLCAVEGIGLHMARRERSVADRWPGSELECLVARGRSPFGDLLQRALRHARRQHPQLQVATTSVSSGAGTSTH